MTVGPRTGDGEADVITPEYGLPAPVTATNAEGEEMDGMRSAPPPPVLPFPFPWRLSPALWLHVRCCVGCSDARTTRCPAVEKVDSGAEADESLTGEFTWAIENYTKLKQVKLYSPVFQSGQYNW